MPHLRPAPLLILLTFGCSSDDADPSESESSSSTTESPADSTSGSESTQGTTGSESTEDTGPGSPGCDGTCSATEVCVESTCEGVHACVAAEAPECDASRPCEVGRVCFDVPAGQADAAGRCLSYDEITPYCEAQPSACWFACGMGDRVGASTPRR